MFMHDIYGLTSHTSGMTWSFKRGYEYLMAQHPAMHLFWNVNRTFLHSRYISFSFLCVYLPLDTGRMGIYKPSRPASYILHEASGTGYFDLSSFRPLALVTSNRHNENSFLFSTIFRAARFLLPLTTFEAAYMHMVGLFGVEAKAQQQKSLWPSSR
jgi:hypothetical protein